ncbi:MAG: apolipoprotein N-acyltransferase [Deltaproteobacteria bacterium]|nr:apolipoprotein N-acyltransferase [Deltaproteobacteria bacterium]
MLRSPMRPGVRLLLAACSGVFFTLLYDPFDATALAWITITPLLLALDDASPLMGAALGWVTGTVGSAGITAHWIYCAARDYFDLAPLAAAGFAFGATQILGAIHVALFGLAVTLLPRRRWRAMVVAALFVATEYQRAHLPLGGPWTFLGQSQTNLMLMQLSDFTGVQGMSFVCALVASALVDIRRTRVPLVVAALLLTVVCIYGQWRLSGAASVPDATLRVALVQGNLPNHQRGRPEFFSAHLDQYLDLSRSVLTPRPDLIVWPENAVGFFIEENPPLLQRITDLLQEPGASLLAGAPRSLSQSGIALIYNSAYLLSRNGIDGFYDKRRLLPFVERMPLRGVDGPYAIGGAPTVFSLSAVRFGALICYEAIYPELARDLVQRGARLLVNISNDSWFDAGAGPVQHYALARFRSVENRVSLVRVANSGVSGVIDPYGREIAHLPQNAAASISVNVPLGSGDSFYSRHGEWFALLCIVASIAALLWGIFARRRS